jgi:hypothetical protein
MRVFVKDGTAVPSMGLSPTVTGVFFATKNTFNQSFNFPRNGLFLWSV